MKSVLRFGAFLYALLTVAYFVGPGPVSAADLPQEPECIPLELMTYGTPRAVTFTLHTWGWDDDAAAEACGLRPVSCPNNCSGNPNGAPTASYEFTISGGGGWFKVPRSMAGHYSIICSYHETFRNPDTAHGKGRSIDDVWWPIFVENFEQTGEGTSPDDPIDFRK